MPIDANNRVVVSRGEFADPLRYRTMVRLLDKVTVLSDRNQVNVDVKGIQSNCMERNLIVAAFLMAITHLKLAGWN